MKVHFFGWPRCGTSICLVRPWPWCTDARVGDDTLCGGLLRGYVRKPPQSVSGARAGSQQAPALMRSLLLVRALVSVAAAAAAAPDPTQCEGGPCGPGNERCAGVKVQTFVFHLFDTSCHTNDQRTDV
jgi:hypothetical protein